MGLDKQTHGTGFEDAPHMVPGEVESGKEYDPRLNSASGGRRKILSLALLCLLSAGGWGYLNQEHVKETLGYKSQATCASRAAEHFETIPGGCPYENGAVAELSEGVVPCSLQAPSGSRGLCCEQGKSAALAAALLKGVDFNSSESVVTSVQDESQQEETTSTRESQDDSLPVAAESEGPENPATEN